MFILTIHCYMFYQKSIFILGLSPSSTSSACLSFHLLICCFLDCFLFFSLALIGNFILHLFIVLFLNLFVVLFSFYATEMTCFATILVQLNEQEEHSVVNAIDDLHSFTAQRIISILLHRAFCFNVIDDLHSFIRHRIISILLHVICFGMIGGV